VLDMTVGKSNPPPAASAGTPAAAAADPTAQGAVNTAPVSSAHPKWIFVTVIVAVFVSNLDLFVVNVAMPDIARDYAGTSLSSLSWVLNAYAIVFAALLVVLGRLFDRNGLKRGFIIGLAVFTLGSVVCAIAPGLGWLIAARVVQAIGAAVLIPTSLALLVATTAPHRRSGVVRAWSAMGGVAAALGPVIGGLLTEIDWRWVFIINVPIGIVALIASFRVLPEIRGDRSEPLPDILGAALLTVAIGALALGLVQADEWGWLSGGVLGSFATTLVLMVLFVRRSRSHPSPVIELPLLKVPSFSLPTIATLLFTVAFLAMIFSAALWAQNVWGYSALKTGLAMAPGPLMVPILAIAAGPLVKRIGAGPVAALGNLFLGVGVLWWRLTAEAEPDYLGSFLPGLIIGGIGVGLALPTLIAAATTALPHQRLATASGVLNMARQIGAVLGVAMLVSILGTPGSPAAAVDAFHDGWVAIVLVCVLATVAALTIRKDNTVSTPAEPPATAVAL
jgi:EmrB/QacA subfamily drug resistance transporter